jgi:hypothetical protein
MLTSDQRQNTPDRRMHVKTGIELPAGKQRRLERLIVTDLPSGDPGGFSIDFDVDFQPTAT